jgi:signal transduction histidine kinase
VATVAAGSGLAIVRTVARAHGGEAHAANVEGGADVWLTLPAPTPSDPDMGQPT